MNMVYFSFFVIILAAVSTAVISQRLPGSIQAALIPRIFSDIPGPILERINRINARKGTVDESPPIAPIMNGTDAQEHKYPCEGAFYIFAGVHDLSVEGPLEQLVSVETVRLHERFRWSGTYLVRDDIALLITDEPFNFTTIAVRPVPRLSTRISDVWSLKANNCVAIGWGNYVIPPPYQYPDILQQKTPINVVSNRECNQVLRRYDLGATPKMICSLDPDGSTCFGDSGSSLGCYDRRGQYYQIGITSWGKVTEGHCIGENVYVRVSKYCRWIAKNMYKV